jgi:hypothetical protein
MSAPTSPSTPTQFKNTAMTQITDRLLSAHTEIVAMTNIVKLAQFATEARRTLQGINDLGRIKPEVEAANSRHVEASHEWEMCPDVVGQVLGYAITRLERAEDELERARMAMTESAANDSAQGGGAAR